MCDEKTQLYLIYLKIYLYKLISSFFSEQWLTTVLNFCGFVYIFKLISRLFDIREM